MCHTVNIMSQACLESPVLLVKLDSKAVHHSPVNASQPGEEEGESVLLGGGRFDHKITTTLKPSVIILDWYTVQYLSEFIALLTSTHKE